MLRITLTFSILERLQLPKIVWSQQVVKAQTSVPPEHQRYFFPLYRKVTLLLSTLTTRNHHCFALLDILSFSTAIFAFSEITTLECWACDSGTLA